MADNAHNAVHAATEAHGGAEHGGVFPAFDPTHFASQLIWLAIVFGLLYFLMSRVALPRVARILEDRTRKIETELRAARAAQAQAETAQAMHEKTLADARASAQATAQEAQARLAADADAHRRRIEDELNAKLSAAESRIAETRGRAMANVGAIASDAAAAIVETVTGARPDAQRVAAAVAAVSKG